MKRWIVGITLCVYAGMFGAMVFAFMEAGR